VEDNLRRWFDSDEDPSDFYELLGKPRLHPVREDLLEGLRAAYRAVHTFENNAPAARLPRARDLQRRLMEAEQVLGNDDEWRAYDQSLAGHLRMRYVAGAGRDPAKWRLENLRGWLANQSVHPARIEELVKSFVAETSGSGGDPDRTLASGLLETIKASTPVEPVPPPQQRSRPAAPAGSEAAAQARAPRRPAQRDDAIRAGVPAGSAPPRSAPPRPAVPMPRTSRAAPPARAAAAQPGPAPPLPAGPGGPRAKASSNLLWMIGAAVMTAVVFGVIGVAIVLARR
jgi:hypothetical protein